MPGDGIGEVEGQRLPGVGFRGDCLGLDGARGIARVLDLEPHADACGGRVHAHRHARVGRVERYLPTIRPPAVPTTVPAKVAAVAARFTRATLLATAGRIRHDLGILGAPEAAQRVVHRGRVEGHRGERRRVVVAGTLVDVRPCRPGPQACRTARNGDSAAGPTGPSRRRCLSTVSSNAWK